MCVRPKLYLSNQTGVGVANIRDARTLVPDIFSEAPQESLDVRTGGGGSLNTSANYVHDVSSVYVLGDQFVMGDVPSTALPNTTTLAKTYPVMADVDELFVEPGDPEAEPDPIAPVVFIHADGQASFAITGRKVLGTTPGYYTD